MQKNILIIEDEPGLRITLSDRLNSEGYRVETASNGDDGFRQAINSHFDLIILDVMLPLRNGLDVCRDLREHGVMVPILILTAKDQTFDKVLGLKIGADDYLTKPFEMLELLARVEALLRRATSPASAPAAIYQFGSISVDLRRTEVVREEKPITLSAKEFQLLRYFIEHRGETLSRQRLLEEVWGYSSIPNTRTVDMHVSWLRQKLEEDPKSPRWIVTVIGLGYKFLG